MAKMTGSNDRDRFGSMAYLDFNLHPATILTGSNDNHRPKTWRDLLSQVAGDLHRIRQLSTTGWSIEQFRWRARWIAQFEADLEICLDHLFRGEP